jgi:hypothetical protein
VHFFNRRIGKNLKKLNAIEFCRPNASRLSFRTLSASEVQSLLVPFFNSLTFDQRRARFGCGVSDDAIVRYCRGLDADEATFIACIAHDALIALVELHQGPALAGCTELGIASSANEDRLIIYGHLLQLAAFAAGRQGYQTFICPAYLVEQDVLSLLRGMGHVAFRNDFLSIDLGEYVRLHMYGA